MQATVVTPSGKIEPETGEHSGATAPSTRSAAEAAKTTAAPAGEVASCVVVSGTVRAGPVVSVTTMSKLWVPTLPCESVAVHVTGDVPTGNVEPGAGAHDCETTASSGSLAVNV